MPTLYDNFSQVKQYIDQNQVDLSSYVSKSELSEMSYATTSQLPVIDENLIPKENNTYTLGDQNYLYSATYTSRVKVGNNSQMYNDSGGITFSINSNNGVRIGSSAIYPKTSGGFSLGSSSNSWSYTYTQNLILNGTDINDYLPVINESIVPKETGTYTLGDADHLYAASYTKSTYFTNNTKIVGSGSDINFYTGGLSRIKINNNILRPDRTGVNLGTSSNKWDATYTYNLYADTAYLQDTSYSSSIVPKENLTYQLGDRTHNYKATYTSSLKSNDNGITIQINDNNKYYISSSVIRPITTNNIDLGTSNYKWAATYTSNLYADTIHNFIWTGTSAEYAALPDYTTYQIYMIKES